MIRFFPVTLIFLLITLNCYSKPALPPLIGFLINNGEKYTNNPEIKVRLRSLKNPPNLLEAMQIGTKSDLFDAEWQPFSSEPVALTLTEGDGEKFVYARLKDKAGNISEIETSFIILDTKPPVDMEFAINKGAQYTNDKTGRVFLQIKGNDAVAWQVSNNSNFANAPWEALSNNKTWNIDLRGGDGEKIIYARFKDEAGNVTEPLSKSIILDTEAPKNGSVAINSGEKFTRSTSVKLKIKADGAHIVRITDRVTGQNFDFVPEADGFMTVDWKFDTLQGKKFVKAFFMDAATNKTTAPAEAEIIYDTKGPAVPNIVIDNGNKHTNSKEGKVDLQIMLRENEPNLKLFISNEETFAGTQSQDFVPTIKGYSISTQEDGLKTIFIKLTDEAGNSSSITSSSIILDRTSPKVKGLKINDDSEYVILPKVNLTIEAEDAVTIQISNNPNFSPAPQWEQFRPLVVDWKIIPGDGEKTVYARFKDAAGNVSDTHSASIILDTQPPVGKFVIDSGQKFTNNKEAKVSLSVMYEGEDAMGMQIANSPDFTNAKLLPLKKENIEWQLEGNDGIKTVFLRLKDKAGNYSTVFASNIILDRNAPENCEIRINNGEEWTTNASGKVALSLTAADAYKMKISNASDLADAEWIPYRTSVGWTLPGQEGEHTVYALFADQADNHSATVSAKIKSDFTAPAMKTFSAEGNKKFCNDPQKRVKLLIEAEGAHFMAIDNTPVNEASSWEPYQTTKDWILSNEDALKTIYVRFKDLAGNVSAEQTLKIMLDRVPPIENEITINQNEEWFTDKDGKATLFIKSNGASEMMLSSTPNFGTSTWEAYVPVKEGWPIDVKKPEASVHAKFRDLAGNVSETVSDNIKIDATPPVNPKVIINKGDKYLTSKDRKMMVGISVEGAKFMRLSIDKNFRDTDWEPVGGMKEIVVLEGDGVKTVYAQFKDQAENLSEIVSDDIILDTTPPVLTSFEIDNGAEWSNHDEKKVLISIEAEDAVEMRLDHDPAFANSNWQKYATSIKDYVLPGEDGEKILFLILKDEAGNVSTTYSAKIKLKRSF